MLLSFSVKNWMSFKGEAEFSMLSTREKQHGDRLLRMPKYGMRMLPVAVIYGGNSAGKTSFFKAMKFAADFITEGVRPDALIMVDPYRLDDRCLIEPTLFCFEIFAGETLYKFSFSLSTKEIVEEKLEKISRTRECVLYHRKKDDIVFDNALKDKDLLSYIHKSTRANQLFLTSSVYQNYNQFKSVYDWFRDKLEFISPNSWFQPFERFWDKNDALYNEMISYLRENDSRIERLEGVIIPIENIPMPSDLKEKIQYIPEGKVVKVCLSGDRFVISNENNRLVVRKMMAVHLKEDGTELYFDMSRESDGTLRAIDLFPVFSNSASDSSKLYVIDELDRSIHPHLLENLINSYLSNCDAAKRRQIVFTTHNKSLIYERIFRKDEIWFVERSANGESELYSAGDFKDIRYDKCIGRAYSDGRLGGVPSIVRRYAF